MSQHSNIITLAFGPPKWARILRPAIPGRVIWVPRAIFEAGRTTLHRPPRLIVLPAGGPTPGDAA